MLEQFDWSDEYSVGLKEIDDQHKALVGMVAEMHVAIVARKGSAACRAILDRLVAYTANHFAVEESLMRLLNYPEFAAHKEEHDALTRQVVDLLEKLDAGKAAISFELLHFLKVWLTQHIVKSDKKYGVYAQARGISSGFGKGAGKKPWWRFW